MRGAGETPSRLSARNLTATEVHDVSFDVRPGEVLGVVALEGQGQDELFDILAGSERPDGGELQVDGKRRSFRHPADAIRAGLVYVAADRAEALLMQRSVRENIALPFSTPLRGWGPINAGGSSRRSTRRSSALQIDTRAQREVRRLSGGNQQKVTIARWVAGGVQTMLCFDPTRGIDIGTKPQIYALLRDLAARAPRSCSTPRSSRRSSSPATGRSSSSAARSLPRSPRPMPTSRPFCAPRTTSGRAPRPPMPRRRRRSASRRSVGTSRMAVTAHGRSRSAAEPAWRGILQRNAWTLGLLGFLAALLVFT